jgi:hypothetical protein
MPHPARRTASDETRRRAADSRRCRLKKRSAEPHLTASGSRSKNRANSLRPNAIAFPISHDRCNRACRRRRTPETMYFYSAKTIFCPAEHFPCEETGFLSLRT